MNSTTFAKQVDELYAIQRRQRLAQADAALTTAWERMLELTGDWQRTVEVIARACETEVEGRETQRSKALFELSADRDLQENKF